MVRKRALVTGDAGFLGRHFKAELMRRGYYVVGCDVRTTPAQDCRLVFRRELHGAGPRLREHWDLVVHCAAVVGGRNTIENDPLATAESLSLDAEMFRWAAQVQPGRVLYISSSAAYPVMLQRGGIRTPLSESDARLSLGMPDEVYGWSKVTGELLADRLRRAGVPVTVVRPFSGYGTDQHIDYPFRAILERVRRLEPGQPLTVWSDAVRDFIHVDDVVRGALAVADSGTELPVNLCTGWATSFTELGRYMLTLADRPDHDIAVLENKPKGVAYRVGDPSRMLDIYEPRVGLLEGIERALKG